MYIMLQHNYGIGAVISHIFPVEVKGQLQHLHRLTTFEKIMPSLKKRGALTHNSLHTIKKFHQYLYNRHFKILSLITSHIRPHWGLKREYSLWQLLTCRCGQFYLSAYIIAKSNPFSSCTTASLGLAHLPGKEF